MAKVLALILQFRSGQKRRHETQWFVALLFCELVKVSFFRRALFEIQGPVGGAEKVSDGLAIVRINCDAGAYSDRRFVSIRAHALGNSIRNAQSRLGVR